MNRQNGHSYEFGPFRLDPAERRLTRQGVPVPLRPKVFDTLVVLVENGGHLIEKDELMQRLWPDSFVEENSLNKIISMLRHILGEGHGENLYIETVPKRGYRFVADVRELRAGADLIVERLTRTRIVAEEEETTDQIELQSVGETILAPTAHGAPETVAHANRNAVVNTEYQRPSVRTLLNSDERNRKSLFLALALVAIAITCVFAWREYAGKKHSSNAVSAPFRTVSLSRLTTSGKAVRAAISPDGTYFAHAREEQGRQSLWLRQVAEARDVQIVPATNAEYWAVIFSPDSKYIYYVAWEGNRTSAALYRVPVLGGPAKRLLDEIGSSLSFAPDGQRFAYVNEFSSRGESFLIVTNADGTGGRALSARKAPQVFSSYPHSGPAWSPDGKFIVTSVGSFDKSGNNKKLFIVDVDDGVERPFTSKGWASVGAIAWFDASSLILVARDEKASPSQLWRVLYPSGEAQKITNDLNDYRGVSMTSDSSAILSVRTERIVRLSIVPDGAPGGEIQIASEAGPGAGEECPAWTPDGKIALSSNGNGRQDIWIMNADGNERKQLTSEAGNNIHPSVCAGGRFIVFASDRTGSYHIWRMDIDGGNPRQLTNGEKSEAYPHCSPDGRWVVYQNGYGWVKATLWTVAMDGGEAKQLTNKMSIRPAISPDGKSIAYYYMDADVWGLAVIKAEGGQQLKKYDISPSVKSRIVHWTPDGKSLAYVDTRASTSNIWSQPLDGGPPKPLTQFKSDYIFHFNWSPDGKRILVGRGTESSDVTLIKDAR